jgi:cobalt transporter subunit CbtB
MPANIKSSDHNIVNTSNFTSLGFAALLGGFLILGAGLLQSSTIHNAAHDVRHAIGFPCH